MSFLGPVRWRWWGMQAALCGVLLGTLGLAALLKHERQARSFVALGAPASAAGMQVPQPAKWTSRQLRDGIAFDEPAGSQIPGRHLEVHHLQGAGFVSPLEFLVAYEELDVRTLAVARSAGERSGDLEDASVAGWPGALVSQTLYRRLGRQAIQVRKHTVACAVLPGGDAVLVQLDGEGAAGASDEDLVRRLAAAIQVENGPTPQPAAALALSDDVTFTAPPGMQTPRELDKFRVDRTLYAADGRGWLAAQVVACYFPKNFGAADFAAMLRLRDPAFAPGDVKAPDKGAWSCERKGDGQFPAVAFLQRGPDGRAVLAEFRWNGLSDRVDRQSVDAAWRVLAASIQFQKHVSYDALVDAGHKATEKLPPDPLDLLDREHLSESWQWYQETGAQDWFTRIRYRIEPQAIGADLRTDPSPRGQEMARWVLSRDWSVYEQEAVRMRPGWVRTQRTVQRDGKVSMALAEGRTTLRSPPAKRDLFVPGGLLPLLMARFPYQSMILQTDAIPTSDDAAASMPMTLILEPSFDVPRTAGEDPDPLRCWSVRVNGRGQRSRWYFDKEGKLQFISFAGGVHLQRSEDSPEPE